MGSSPEVGTPLPLPLLAQMSQQQTLSRHISQTGKDNA